MPAENATFEELCCHSAHVLPLIPERRRERCSMDDLSEFAAAWNRAFADPDLKSENARIERVMSELHLGSRPAARSRLVRARERGLV
jgi:hypothetical protein